MTRRQDGWVYLSAIVVGVLIGLLLSGVLSGSESLTKTYNRDDLVVCTVYVEDNAIAQSCERL